MDDGDGKLTAETCAGNCVGRGVTSVGRRWQRFWQRTRGCGRTEKRAQETSIRHRSGFDKVSFRVNSRGSPPAAARKQARATMTTAQLNKDSGSDRRRRSHIWNVREPNPTWTIREPNSTAARRHPTSLSRRNALAWCNGPTWDHGLRPEPSTVWWLDTANIREANSTWKLREPNPKSHQLYDGSSSEHSRGKLDMEIAGAKPEEPSAV